MKKFQAESQKLLDMMVNSIYTNKEIFLRELISNASDALDKMHIQMVDSQEMDFDKDQFWIRLTPDEEERTLVVEDSGIGMDEEDLEKNLGTIAHSGSDEFKKSANEEENIQNIIGQFGVGFYSAFMVADKVEVLTKPYGSDQAWLWTSDGSEGYTIEPAEKEDHGTRVKLYLRENEEGEDYDRFLKDWTLENLVEKYSNYIRYPIKMLVTDYKPVEKEEGEEEKAGDEEKDDQPKYEEVEEDKTLNSMVPIWNKNRKDLEDEDYINFYQQEHLGMDKPLHWIHMVVDGMISYRAILYIPSRLPVNFYSKNFKQGLSLYSRGVKIMDHAEDLLPDYFGFIQGVVASDDFSLNVSRETLQEDRQLISIGRQLEKRLIRELKDLLENDREKYIKFFDAFGTQVKAGIYESFGAKKDQLAPLLIFDSSKGDGKRSLDEIVDAIEGEGQPEEEEKEGDQDQAKEAGEETGSEEKTEDKDEEKDPIYYVTGESIQQIDKLPALQKLKEEDKEVIYAIHRIDEFTFKAMRTYRDHPFQSIQAADESKDEEEEEQGLLKEMKKSLGDEVVRVKKSDRLKDDAVMLTAQGDVSIDMEKTWQAHTINGFPMVADKVLEVNPNHPLYKLMQAWYLKEDYEKIDRYTKLLYNQARLIEGLPLDDPVGFSQDLQKLMTQLGDFSEEAQ